ncbi:MAG: Hsp20/alpha crystallin family protein [Bacteroidia bacterium]|nr:Hsp20/alpha crystallin family protein [Bacteroidia bacterium]
MTLVKFKNAGGFNHMPGITKGFGFPSFFNDNFDRLWTGNEDTSWMPWVNIKERTGDYNIDLAVPGMDKKDFKVEVENDLLTISGESKEEINEENEKLTRREFHYGTFKRSFTLPETSDAEKISATYNNGVLTILVAKKELAKANPKKEIVIA